MIVDETRCDKCIENDCDPTTCDCECHYNPFDKFDIFKNKG